MQTTFLVNRVSVHPKTVAAIVAGETAQATVDQIEIELVDETGQHGTITRRYHLPSHVTWARTAFRQGQQVTLDDSPVTVPEPAPAA